MHTLKVIQRPVFVTVLFILLAMGGEAVNVGIATNAQAQGIHGGRTISGCFPGSRGNCFVKYTNGSYQDIANSSCTVVAGCTLNTDSSATIHGSKTVASCYDGASNNCFVNYTDGSYRDFYNTSCPAVNNCDGLTNPGSGGGHNGRTVKSCFAGGSGNCFVNYTNGTFRDFLNKSCSALSGCNQSPRSDNPQQPTSAAGFKPSLFRNYKASDCNYIVYPGNSFTQILSGARPGQKVCLKGGVHQGGQYVSDVKGTQSQFITLMSYPGETAQIVASGAATHGIKILKNVSYFEVYNLDLRGASPGPYGSFVPTTQGFPSGIAGGDVYGSVHHLKIVNNRIRDFAGGGINLYYMSHADIQGNTVSNTSRFSMNMESGISIYKPVNNGHTQNNWADARGDTYSILIRHNIVFDNENRATVPTTINGVTSSLVSDGNCIVLDSYTQSYYSGRSLVTQNVCYNNGGSGFHLYHANNVTVRNNTSIFSGKTWWDGPNNGYIKMWGETGELSNVGDSRNNVFENNLVWAEPYNNKAWNLRVEAGPPIVYGSGRQSMTQSIAVLNTQIRNNIFVVSGNQSAPFLPTNNGNQIVSTNPGLLMTPNQSSFGKDYRIQNGSMAGRANVGATYFGY